MSAWMEVKEIFCIQRRTRGLGSRCLGPAHQLLCRWQLPRNFSAFLPASLLHLSLWPLHTASSFCSYSRPCHSQGLWTGGSWINCPSLVRCGVGGRRVRWFKRNSCPSKICGPPISLHEEAAEGQSLEPGPVCYPVLPSFCFTHTAHPLCQPPQIQQQCKHGLSLRDSCPCVWGGN